MSPCALHHRTTACFTSTPIPPPSVAIPPPSRPAVDFSEGGSPLSTPLSLSLHYITILQRQESQSAAPTDRLHTTQPIADRARPSTASTNGYRPHHDTDVSWCGPTGLPAATGHVMSRATSSLRSGTSNAMPCVVGDVQRSTPCASARLAPSLRFRHEPCYGRARRSAAWLVNRRSPHPRRFAARPIPCYAPPPPLSHKQLSVAENANVVAHVGSLCASGSGSSPARP